MYKRQEQQRAKVRKSASNRAAANAKPSNAAPAHPTRSWQQFFVDMALKLLWYLVRFVMRSIAAHSVEQRYGLFISTLSYRKIRAYRLEEARLKLLGRRGQENERIIVEQAFRLAADDLTRHLGVVRGRHPRTFRHLARRPIRIASRQEFEKFTSKYVHYIA